MSDADLDLDSRVPASASEWAEWLDAEKGKTLQVYKDKPQLLIADFRREQAISRDYEGREILELLQNANDAAADAGILGKAIIDLSHESLLVANTGQAFSCGGVRSMQTDHLSPKPHGGGTLIGNKGLGLRAILNWSREPVILSGSLRLAYSRSVLSDMLGSLVASNSEIARLVAREAPSDGGPPIALLPFPVYSAGEKFDQSLVAENGKRMLVHCQRWIDAGYQTAIGMPFDAQLAYERAVEQVKDLRPEFLLFVPSLSELCVRVDGKEEVWSRDLEGNSAHVHVGEALPTEWRVFRTKASVPLEERDADDAVDAKYELVVAVPMGKVLAKTALFSYFPTDVELPLAAVCHATLELSQNRKHPQARRSNGFVLKKLAEYIAEVAEKHGATELADPWSACRLVMPTGDFPVELSRVRFREGLIEAAQSRAIVPTFGKGLVKPADAKLLEGANANWIPEDGFSEVAIIRTEKDVAFFRELKVPAMDGEDFIRRASSLAGMDIPSRANLIEGILAHKFPREFQSASLLLDAAEKAIPAGSRVFLAPEKSDAPSLPDWVDLRFLNQNLEQELKTRLKPRNARDMQDKLEGFGVVEYSLTNVVRALLADAQKKIEAESDSAAKVDEDVLRAVFELYKMQAVGDQRPEFPRQLEIRLPAQNGVWAGAGELYFGQDYEPYGLVTQRLFEVWAPERLVAGPTGLGLEAAGFDLRDFLSWLGVAVWPRTTRIAGPDRDYISYALSQIAYPARFDDYLFNSSSEVGRASASNVETVDGLESILRSADALAILAWLARDDRAAKWQRPTNEHGALTSRPGQTQNNRRYDGPIPSHVRWAIEHTSWLPLGNGQKGRPRDCVVAARIIETLFPRPAIPDEARLSEYRLSTGELREGWARAGVVSGLESLERDEIYARLLELPQRDPEGQAARALYRWLLDSNDLILGQEGPACRAFKTHGQMWGKHAASQGYVTVSELRHVDFEGLPDALTAQLRIVDLPKRVGADKVERLFGVASVERAGIRQSVHRYQLALGATEAATAFESAKPFIFALRQSQTAQRQNLQALKDLHLVICSELVADVEYEGRQLQHDVELWGWVFADSALYVRADPVEPATLSSDLLADAIGAAIAAMFRLGGGGDFARMIRCSERDRRELLRRMRGEGVEQNLAVLEEQFAGTTAPITGVPFPMPPAPTILPPKPNVDVRPPDVPLVDGGSDAGAVGSDLEITQVPHTPADPPVRRPLQIQQTTRPSSGGSGRRVTDWAFCERKVEEFESSASQGRFPLPVSHLTGYEAFGCDILSFANAESRAALKEGRSADLKDVVRFIEVKGRSDPGAQIELKGNERSKAEQFGARYCLYRLYEDTTDSFRLTILQNPLSEKSAIELVVHVDLDRAESTERFVLSGGLARTSASATSDAKPAAVEAGTEGDVR